MFRAEDEVQVPLSVKGSESEPAAGAEGFCAVLGAKRELELAQLEEELEKKRRKLIEMGSDMAELEKHLEMEEVGRDTTYGS
jgi:hypothetical protein